MTLRELLRDKELPVKVFHKTSRCVVEVNYKNKAAVLATYINNGIETFFNINMENWELCVEPKKTRTVYEYLVNEGSKVDFYWNEFYESDEDFKKRWPRSPIIKTGRSHTFEVK